MYVLITENLETYIFIIRGLLRLANVSAFTCIMPVQALSLPSVQRNTRPFTLSRFSRAMQRLFKTSSIYRSGPRCFPRYVSSNRPYSGGYRVSACQGSDLTDFTSLSRDSSTFQK